MQFISLKTLYIWESPNFLFSIPQQELKYSLAHFFHHKNIFLSGGYALEHYTGKRNEAYCGDLDYISEEPLEDWLFPKIIQKIYTVYNNKKAFLWALNQKFTRFKANKHAIVFSSKDWICLKSNSPNNHQKNPKLIWKIESLNLEQNIVKFFFNLYFPVKTSSTKPPLHYFPFKVHLLQIICPKEKPAVKTKNWQKQIASPQDLLEGFKNKQKSLETHLSEELAEVDRNAIKEQYEKNKKKITKIQTYIK